MCLHVHACLGDPGRVEQQLVHHDEHAEGEVHPRGVGLARDVEGPAGLACQLEVPVAR